MKNKMLYTKVKEAAESLCNALRAYSDEPLYCNVTVFTRDNTIAKRPEDVPDYYNFVVAYPDEVDEDIRINSTVISESAKVFYGDKGIRSVEPYYSEVEDDE